VPHPTDVWKPGTFFDLVDWRSRKLDDKPDLVDKSKRDKHDEKKRRVPEQTEPLRRGGMMMQIDEGTEMKPGLIEGQGRVWLGVHGYRQISNASGQIRVKIIPADDE
jgi:hypothetical protein